MSELVSFLARFDDQKEPPTPEEDAALLDDAGMRRACEEMAPFFARLADRAGVEVGELYAEAMDRMGTIPAIALARSRRRVVAGMPAHRAIQLEMMGALANIYTEAFLVGVLWEQERHLPDPTA